MSLRSDLRSYAHKAGGATLTRNARLRHGNQLADVLAAQNVQIKLVEHLKAKHIEIYVQTRLADGISKRTVQNEMSSLRQILRTAGRSQLADLKQISNRAVGVGNASRDGTKTAMPDGRFRDLGAAVAQIDEGVAACVELQRALGLRAQEAVMSPQHLATWSKHLADGKAVTIQRGTKGGRRREVTPADRKAAQKAVERAIAVAKGRGGLLVPGNGLKGSMARYARVMRAAGFRGREAGHSLRYAFAQQQIAAYRAAGFSEREVWSLTSTDLGHGDGRGRYVKQVYGR